LITIGLTGGIGSGKSTAAAMFAGLGAVICDADQVNRTLIKPGGPAVKPVLKALGRDLAVPGGGLDKTLLAARVFKDAKKRNILESITHPMIMEEVSRRLKDAEKNHAPAFVLEAALLIETGLYKGFDYLVIVHAKQKIALERTMQRDNVTSNEVLERMKAQLTNREYLNVADYVIENNGTLDGLKQQVDSIWREIFG